MPKAKCTEAVFLATLEEHNGNRQRASEVLGVDIRSVYKRIESMKKRGIHVPGPSEPLSTHIEIEPLSDPDLTYEEIKEKRLLEFQRKSIAAKQRSLIKAKVKMKGAIALFLFGDPHVDDPGTDLKLLYDHTELINNTEGMFCANIGDTTNNWVGRLKAQYANQSTTHSEAWKLAEGWIGELKNKWLFLIGGNHDAWSGSGDPLKWICNNIGAFYELHQFRVSLEFPNGTSSIVNSRHDWPGHSQWNPTHALLKAGELGMRDDIYIAGHRHISGYQQFKAGDGSIIHAARVATYKTFDSYAVERGFRDHIISPCVVFVIDPENGGPDRIKHFFDPFAAADYLGFLRGRS